MHITVTDATKQEKRKREEHIKAPPEPREEQTHQREEHICSGMTVEAALRLLPSKERVWELRRLREELRLERCARTQALLLAARSSPAEVRWLGCRRVEMLRGLLLAAKAGGLRGLEQLSQEWILQHFWRRAAQGHISLKTLAEYGKEMLHEVEVLRRPERGDRGVRAQLKRLATLIPPSQAAPLTTKEYAEVLKRAKDVGSKVYALATFLWQAAGRLTETLEVLPRDITRQEEKGWMRGDAEGVPGHPPGLLLRVLLRNKASERSWEKPVLLRGEAAEAVRAVAEKGQRDRPVWTREHWHKLKTVLPPGKQKVYAFRRGVAQAVAEEAAAQAVKDKCRHASTNLAPRYLAQQPLPPQPPPPQPKRQ